MSPTAAIQNGPRRRVDRAGRQASPNPTHRSTSSRRSQSRHRKFQRHDAPSIITACAPRARGSYLKIEAIIAAAQQSGAEAFQLLFAMRTRKARPARPPAAASSIDAATADLLASATDVSELVRDLASIDDLVAAGGVADWRELLPDAVGVNQLLPAGIGGQGSGAFTSVTVATLRVRRREIEQPGSKKLPTAKNAPSPEEKQMVRPIDLGHRGRGDVAAQRRRKAERIQQRRAAARAVQRPCANCGVMFVPGSGRGRSPLHCCTACRRAADNSAKRARRAASSAGAP
jgi:hypothetical protein